MSARSCSAVACRRSSASRWSQSSLSTKPDVARLAGPAGVGDVLHAHVAVALRQLVQARGRLVGRAVVDEDQLQVVLGQRLPEQRLDAVVDV
jgi:hypothetical protein